MKPKTNILTVAIAAAVMGLAVPATVLAQYDAMDGPIIKDAQAAISKGDVTGVLKWVPKENEEEVRKAFARTMTVRNKGLEARDLADDYFFETVVRLYCQGTGQLYTGLRPAGQSIPPEMTEVDKALDAGKVDDLAKKIASAVEEALRQRFSAASEARKQKDSSAEAGRMYAAAYMQLVNFIGDIYLVIEGRVIHAAEPPAAPQAPAQSGGSVPIIRRHMNQYYYTYSEKY
jgi:hypothetical protein